MSPGTRITVRIDEVVFRSVDDSHEPQWAIAVADDGTSYLIYGVRHLVVPRVGMRAIMEYQANDKWLLIADLPQ